MIFVDSNIPMYAAGLPHPNRQPAIDLLAEVQRGAVIACTSAEVLQEILYRYRALDRLELAFEVYDIFVSLVPSVLPVRLEDTNRARQLLESVPGLGVRDAIHAAVALNHGVTLIASFDRVFDRVPGLKRVQAGDPRG